MPSRQVNVEMTQALERYNEVNGLGPQNPKVTRLRRTAKPATPAKKISSAKRRRQMTAAERLSEALAQLDLKPLPAAENLPPYDVTRATRYPAVEWTKEDGVRKLDLITKRYGFAMREQHITAADLRNWREHFMFLTVEQAAAMVRVTPRTVRNWESGHTEIPFSMWWVMHCTMQDPEYFLTRPGFHDFYIEHCDGESFLCSSTHPDIRYSAHDLFVNRSAINELFNLRAEIERQAARVDVMTAENTRLRQALKAKGLTQELQAMHNQLSSLMQKLATADVVDFPELATTQEQAEIIPLKQASA